MAWKHMLIFGLLFLFFFSGIMPGAANSGYDCTRARDWYEKGKSVKNNNERAIFYLRKAIELCPDYIDAYIQLSFQYLEERKYDKAEDTCKSGLEHDPFSSGLHLNLGASYNLQGKFKKAKLEFEKATELNPEHDTAWRDLGRLCLYLIQDYKAAIQSFEKAYNIEPQALTLFYWSRSLAKDGKYSSALTRAQLCNDKFRKNSFCYSALSLIYSSSNDDKYLNGEKAVEYANQLLLMEGEKGWVLDALAAAKARNGDFDAAVATCSKSIKMLKRNQRMPPSHKKIYLKEKEILLKLFQQRRPCTDAVDM